MKAIQITIDELLLEAMDALPEAKQRGRSAFIREAIRSYMAQMRSERIDAAYRKGYGDGLKDPDLGPWEEAQAWPED